jgi:gliding motility-associated-like protein
MEVVPRLKIPSSVILAKFVNIFKIFIMKLKKIILSLSAFMLIGSASAQLTVTGGQTVVDLVTNVLVGGGLNISNITYNGTAPAADIVQPGVQFFEYTGVDFPFSSGVILRTDGAPSVNADPDLNALSAPFNVTNGSIVEFDFVATGDTMNFQYIFASSEYTSYTCSSFNDAFGFFLSGPGISGPYSNGAINLATIPGTNTPVAINTVNSGFPANNPTCLAANPNYMTDNIYFTLTYNTIMQPIGGGYNGATVALIAASGLVCDEIYHIKLGVANVGDQALQSAVFLEAESFQVFGYDIVVQPSVFGPMTDSLMAENCVSAQLMVVRAPDEGSDTDSTCIAVNWEGTLDPWTDLESWQDSICFPPGVDTLYIDFTPIQDNITEGNEWISITLISVNGCGVETPVTVTLWVTDAYEFTYNVPPTVTVQCIPTTGTAEVTGITGSLPPYTYQWNQNGVPIPGATNSSLILGPGINPQQVIPYSVTVTDLCGTQVTQNVNFIVNQTLDINPNSGPTACGLQTGFVQFPVSGQTGTVAYNLTGPSLPPNGLTQNVAQNLPSGWYYVTATDAVCTATDSVFVDILDPPVASLTASPTAGFSPFTTTFVNQSQNGDSYWWDFGNGETLTVNNTSSQTMTYEGEGPLNFTVCVAAIQQGCQDTACIIVTILEFIPPPYIDAPNVFSPNADGTNDFWQFISLDYVASVELTVLNRWGNIVYEQTAAAPSWDGKTANGNEAAEGVYFYRYKVLGVDGSTLEGHGYFHLVRQ